LKGREPVTPHALGFWSLVVRAMAVHTVTYTLVGMVAFSLFRYGASIREDPVRRASMRPTDDPLVMAGPLFQPLRGALFGVAFYLLRDVVFAPGGWWVLWLTLVIVGILSTFAPAASSIEGLIYLEPSPTGFLWGGLLEILTQSLLLAVVTFLWVRHPLPWLDWLMGALFVLALAMPAMGLAARRARQGGGGGADGGADGNEDGGAGDGA
jgi:hypothetical protein